MLRYSRLRDEGKVCGLKSMALWFRVLQQELETPVRDAMIIAAAGGKQGLWCMVSLAFLTAAVMRHVCQLIRSFGRFEQAHRCSATT